MTSKSTLKINMLDSKPFKNISEAKEQISEILGVDAVEIDSQDMKVLVTIDQKEFEISDLVYMLQELGRDIHVTTSEINVKGMNCISCVARVQGSLMDILGVISVDVNLKSGITRITFLPEHSTEQDFKSALKKAGYELAAP